MGLIVDSFAGGGGASTGIRMATGRDPDIAINHNAEAMAMHKANHPGTRHYIEDIWGVDPLSVTGGEPVDLMWLSPDCTHFSKARGSAPKSDRIRGLAWSAVKWARRVRPAVIVLENVEEFHDWCPLDKHGKAKMHLRGITFAKFVRHLRREGYSVNWRELVACDYGASTSRKRFFLVATADRTPAQWPKPTHGPGRKPYRTAAECIDWSVPAPSIFERKKELADATKRRIAKGIMRYVVRNPKPYIVAKDKAPFITEHANASKQRNFAADDPLRTQCAQVKGGHFALCAAFLQKYHGAHKNGGGGFRGQGLDIPLATLDASGRFGLCTAIITKHYTSDDVGRKVDQPLPTITANDHNSLTVCHLMRQFGTSTGTALDNPLGTVMPQGGGGKSGLVAALMVKYYGSERGGEPLSEPIDTITGKDRFGLVTVEIEGEPYIITDIGMRMLTPRELFNAQGFPRDYIIAPIYNGKPLTKTAQVRMVGNSVCPPVAEAIVKANCGFMTRQEREVA
ncbi:DNA cytosine methyltransferase [Cloacibacillus evryensis]|uniref:DNA cytosine methyltransferase n=1 Tax=Cloacibacillus evryensis TaxID=508460 RepID=UPI0004B2FE54|nr:DNA cytosine methyltransferase [Cloacibacillus evryensis]MEA5034012.1 DNA cytosine methyltransferase [Cloacibacillus evryensis]